MSKEPHYNDPSLLPETEKKKPYLWLFGINFFISAFTFGGGYIVVPMIRKYFVSGRKLFSDEELMNMAAIAQSTPGAIAINLSALAGFRVAGIAGVVVSCIAALIPPLIILAIISTWYNAMATNHWISHALHGMQAGVAALIVDLVVDMTAMIVKERSLLLTLLIPGTFVANFVLGINVATILVTACFVCVLQVWWKNNRRVA